MDQKDMEFSILELEDRLEFAELCDDNCGCTTGGTNTNCAPSGGTTNAYCTGGGGGGGGGSFTETGGETDLSSPESQLYAY